MTLYNKTNELTWNIPTKTRQVRSVLGFIKCRSKTFPDPYIAISFYMPLVRPIHEYACVAWSPSYRCYIDAIVSVLSTCIKEFAVEPLSFITTI